MLKAVLLQLGATLLATAIGAVFFGQRGAVSAALGGLSVVIPSWLFALRLAALARRGATTHVAAFVVGELVKVASIVGLLMLGLALYPDAHWGALLIALILALKANLFAFLVKT
ncbi:ATP synthase subunit I [Pseudothauera rhizosphaerae]|uniref:ATP synthase subunit I n=1 Tax=Pseudothauera rhizosphaerae TaxID=2565932 RepID=A0A4S4AL15_9RHOO|nr:ATP synthase subunit I [Pseudothauera rhizosphaerae]THF60174.1 ATP synthase subunit I [Pseudothauera rhizosphaerae]